MRNLFDQYDQPENRLSHALAVCMHEDCALLRGFLAWIGATPPVRSTELLLVEQSLPGDPPASEEEAERKGLPDIVIHDGAVWCVLIESKVQAALTEDQLTRHERTLRRRGFDQIVRVVLNWGRPSNSDPLSITPLKSPRVYRLSSVDEDTPCGACSSSPGLSPGIPHRRQGAG